MMTKRSATCVETQIVVSEVFVAHREDAQIPLLRRLLGPISRIKSVGKACGLSPLEPSLRWHRTDFVRVLAPLPA